MLDLLKARRSIRKFKRNKVEKALVDQLIQAALLSMSSKNRKPWDFIVVDDESLLHKLAASKQHGSSFLKDAPLGIVITADPEKSDVWIEDTSIAAAILHLTAASLQLGSCWIQIRKRNHNEETNAEEYIRKVLNIPENYKIEAIIAVGYPDEIKPPHDISKLDYDKVHKNGW